ncbi:hypothetical protein IT411_01125, partial [Candidatus Peregrinibacteria bacterium]|nr:hypothetical protein [Candidatus Peregrinibacteria bacterium]
MKPLTLGPLDDGGLYVDEASVQFASEMVINLANIWLATFNRRSAGKKSVMLEALVRAVGEMLKDFERDYQALTVKIKAKERLEYLTNKEVWKESRLIWINHLLRFAGYPELDERNYGYDFLDNFSVSSRPRNEFALVRGRADAAGYYLAHEAEFTDLAAAKKLLALFIFPQLAKKEL